MDFIQYIDTIVINAEGEILLLQRSNSDSFKPGLWTLPGGKLDPTDKSIYQGAMRELVEETALVVNYDDYLDRPMFAFQNQDLSVTHYVIVNCSQKYLLVLASDEHQNYAWVKLDEINPTTLAFPDLVDRIKTVLSLNPSYFTRQPVVKAMAPMISRVDAYDLGMISTEDFLSKSQKPRLITNLADTNVKEHFYLK